MTNTIGIFGATTTAESHARGRQSRPLLRGPGSGMIGFVLRSAFLSVGLAGCVMTPTPTPLVDYVGSGGSVRLSHPIGLTPLRDAFHGTLVKGGWRLSWNGDPAGPGELVVRFSETARPIVGLGRVEETIQVGMSRDAMVVSRCAMEGLTGSGGVRLPNRELGGRLWTVYRHGDAGMSQEVSATDLRTVVDGACYAVARVTYAVKAGPPPPASAREQSSVAASMDAVLESIRVDLEPSVGRPALGR